MNLRKRAPSAVASKPSAKPKSAVPKKATAAVAKSKAASARPAAASSPKAPKKAKGTNSHQDESDAEEVDIGADKSSSKASTPKAAGKNNKKRNLSPVKSGADVDGEADEEYESFSPVHKRTKQHVEQIERLVDVTSDSAFEALSLLVPKGLLSSLIQIGLSQVSDVLQFEDEAALLEKLLPVLKYHAFGSARLLRASDARSLAGASEGSLSTLLVESNAEAWLALLRHIAVHGNGNGKADKLKRTWQYWAAQKHASKHAGKLAGASKEQGQLLSPRSAYQQRRKRESALELELAAVNAGSKGEERKVTSPPRALNRPLSPISSKQAASSSKVVSPKAAGSLSPKAGKPLSPKSEKISSPKAEKVFSPAGSKASSRPLSPTESKVSSRKSLPSSKAAKKHSKAHTIKPVPGRLDASTLRASKESLIHLPTGKALASVLYEAGAKVTPAVLLKVKKSTLKPVTKSVKSPIKLPGSGASAVFVSTPRPAKVGDLKATPQSFKASTPLPLNASVSTSLPLKTASPFPAKVADLKSPEKNRAPLTPNRKAVL